MRICIIELRDALAILSHVKERKKKRKIVGFSSTGIVESYRRDSSEMEGRKYTLEKFSRLRDTVSGNVKFTRLVYRVL